MRKIIKRGFTLAEVLITLAILGVVAAVTLPNMIQDTKYQQIGVKLAKFASNLENGATAYAVGLGGTFSSSNDIFDFINNYMIFKNSGGMSENGTGDLKDGSVIMVYTSTSSFNGINADENIVGLPYFVVAYNPQIKGTKQWGSGVIGGPDYFFAVTNKGFVFPVINDSCLIQIANDGYKIKPALFTDANGVCHNRLP